MSGPVVAGIGEVLWDLYPDAAHFGGAPANFASHAASLGADAWMVSAVGTDPLGDSARSALGERGVNCTQVSRSERHPTGQVRVTLDADKQATYDIAADSAWDHLTWSDDRGVLAMRCDAVCFGTLGQRSPASRTTIQRFVAATPRRALRVFDVNLRQHYFDAALVQESLVLASAVKLNEHELPIVAELCDIAGPDPRAILKAMMSRYDLRLAALTRGAGGALLLDSRDEDECAAPPLAAPETVDTVGAGDAFTATMVVGMLQGLPLAEINRRANAVASFVCSQPGATPPLPAHLRWQP